MRYVPVLFLLFRCALAANPPVNFTFNAGVTCTGFCLSRGIQIQAVTIDRAGNTYFTGNVNLTTFPATSNAFQRTLTPSECTGPPLTEAAPPCNDSFVVKLDPGGNIVWATYLGGNGDDYGTAIVVDTDGNVFVAGASLPSVSAYNDANTFPITPGAAFGPPTPPHTGVFVAKLSADGSGLLYSTFLPGAPNSTMIGSPPGSLVALAIDAGGNAYVTYQSDPSVAIPTTPGAFQAAPQNRNGAGAVLKLNASGTALVYATYLSGAETFPPGRLPNGAADFPMSIAVDGAGNAVVAGTTSAMGFPVTPGAFQTSMTDQENAGFVSKLSGDGSALIYSTYLGGSTTDQVFVVKLDSNGDAYLFGQTSSHDFPGTAGTSFTAPNAGFVTHLSASGSSLVYSVFVPNATSMDLDHVGNVYVSGTDPTATATAFVERLASGGAPSGMETLGGHGVLNDGTSASDTAKLVAVAPNGSVVIGGTVASSNFPGITPGMTAAGVAYVSGFFINATVMNAANYVAGVVAPGEIVAILGYGFGLGGVTFDEFKAPVLYVSGRQINAQVPWEIAGRSSTRMSMQFVLEPHPGGVITYGPFFVAVAPSVPGVFYINNSDGSRNSPFNPAARGDFISVYGTGGGLTNPVGITGGFWPLSPLASLTPPVSITIAGENANVIYSGSAPTLLSGFFQINVRIPADLSPSSAAPMILNIGSGTTTVAVAIGGRD
jgi:uncharacterized protein (TIGR03437 family)